jgi:hypothetical protein
MKVFVGDPQGPIAEKRLQEHGFGRIWVAIRQRWPSQYPGEPWAVDNGAFAAWKAGETWDHRLFRERIHQIAERCGVPEFGVVPDLPAMGENSLDWSLYWHHELRDIAWPWYLAVQDGMTIKMIEPYVALFAGIFLGGTAVFKREARYWCEFAHDRGLSFHYGRASTRWRIWDAYDIGADSLDSTQGLWSEGHWRRIVGAIQTAGHQHKLAL